MSDGGEGMTASYLRIVGGQEVRVTVSGPFGDPVEAVYAHRRQHGFPAKADCPPSEWMRCGPDFPLKGPIFIQGGAELWD